jgi:hypothetical protein
VRVHCKVYLHVCMYLCLYVHSLRLSIVTRFPGSFTHKRHTCLGSHSAFYNKLRARYGRQSFVNRHLLPPLPFSHARWGLKKRYFFDWIVSIVSTQSCQQRGVLRGISLQHESDPRIAGPLLMAAASVIITSTLLCCV